MKIKIYYKSCLVLTILYLFTFYCYNCVVDKFDDKMKIVNSSNETIFVILSPSIFFKSMPVIIDNKNGDTLWNEMRWVKPLDSITFIPPTLGSWEEYVNKICESGRINIFIFENRLLKDISPDSLLLKQQKSKLYTLNINELEKNNWRIIYK
jgi:hypothetical protein